MMETDLRLVAEAGDFLNMMRCAYHEVWRRRFSGDPEISVIAVMVIYEDCEYYRAQMARLACKGYDEGRAPTGTLAQCLRELDGTWRSLYWSVTVKTKPNFVPQVV